MVLHQFNHGRKSWKMYTKELTSISGDDLTISPYEGEDLILEVSGNGNILFKEDGITYNLADLSNAASSNVNLTNYDDASFGNVDICGRIIITVNDVNSQNITLLELKTNTNTPLIKHDFWQNLTGYADYQIYPASASPTDFKIGGYNSTFETIRLNALNGIQIYSNQSTNSYGNIKANDASLNNVDLTGNLNIKSGNLDISNGVINFFASDEQLLGPDTGIVQKVEDLSNSVGDLSNSIGDLSNSVGDLSNSVGDLSNNLLTSNNDASFNNVDLGNNQANTISSFTRVIVKMIQSVFKFYDLTENILASISSVADGAGGKLIFYTKNATSDLEVNQLTIKESGAFGLGSTEDCGITGQVLTSNGAGGAVSWEDAPAVPSNIALHSASPFSNQTVERSRGLFFAGSSPGYYVYPTVVNNINYLQSTRWVGGYQADNLYVYGCHIASTTSDDRLKHNEAIITNGLEIARKLVPKAYDMTEEMLIKDYTGDLENSKRGSGFIAQELLEIPELSHAVQENSDPENTPYRVNYAETIAYAFAAIKELDAIVHTLQARIDVLEAK